MGAALEAGADVPPDALQRAPRRVARRIPDQRATACGAGPRLSDGAAPLLSELMGRTTRYQPVRRTCRTAGTSRTSASTRWCCAAAASSSCRTPAAIPTTASTTSPTRSGRYASTSASTSTSRQGLGMTESGGVHGTRVAVGHDQLLGRRPARAGRRPALRQGGAVRRRAGGRVQLRRGQPAVPASADVEPVVRRSTVRELPHARRAHDGGHHPGTSRALGRRALRDGRRTPGRRGSRNRSVRKGRV